MPRKRRARRFDPQMGVSRERIEAEATYVAIEREHYLLLSTEQLLVRLRTLRRIWEEADQAVEAAVRQMNPRDALAVRCLMARDVYYLAELYRTCLAGKPQVPDCAASAGEPAPTPDEKVEAEGKKALPFREWLFETGT